MTSPSFTTPPGRTARRPRRPAARPHAPARASRPVGDAARPDRRLRLGTGAGSKSYIFQLFHHNSKGVYGDAVANETVTGTHVEGFKLPGGGQYAVRVRSHDPVGGWTEWKIF